MKPTSQDPGRKLRFSSGHNVMNNRTIYVTLAASAGLALLFILVEYASHDRNPLHRLGYGVFVSVLPAVGAFVLLKLTKLLISWRGAVLSTWATAALIYLLLFLLIFSQLWVK